MVNQIGGHEGVGRVLRLGPGLEDGPVKIGDRENYLHISIS